MILTIRTDKPEAELGLYSADGEQLAYESWHAHRELAETIHKKIQQLLNAQKVDTPAITGVVFYAGPGSFTGLRIGAAVANALSASLNIPVISNGTQEWISTGIRDIRSGQSGQAVPYYDSEAKTTIQKK
jgi:tRNA threonylcarbamoyladenosine biosynthesis protein TsaB